MSDFRPEDNIDPFSLESILVEYKGTAFIDGDRRSSEDLLDARIDQIVTQSAEGTLGEEFLPDEPEISREVNTESAAAPVSAEPEPIAPADGKGGADAEEFLPAGREESGATEPTAAENASDVWENPFAEEFPAAPDDPYREEIPDPASVVPPFETADEGTDQDNVGESDGFSFLSLFRKKRKRGDDVSEREENGSSFPAEEKISDENTAQFEWPASREETAGTSPDHADPVGNAVEEAFEETELTAEAPVQEAPAVYSSQQPSAEEHGDGQDSNTEILFFDDYRFAESDEGKEFQTTWDETFYADGQEQSDENDAIDPLAGLRSFLGRLRRRNGGDADEESSEDSSGTKVREEVFVPEPDYTETADAWAKKRHGLMLRSRAALILAFIMTVITVLFERGVYLPGINANGYVLTAVLAFMQLVVMALTVDLLIRGGEDLIRLRPGYETLLLLSSLVVLFCCFGVLGRHDASAGAPFCCVSAFAMALSLWGEYRQVAAMNLSLKTAAASETPEIFVSDYVPEIECNLIKHYSGPADGFYNNLVETDASESAYRALAPIFVCLVILFALVGSIGSGTPFSRCLAASAAASASFSALSAFGVPFSLVARRLRRSGSAVAGWGGADTVYYADGIRICEHDLFPAGATITGIKIFDQKQAEKVIRYTGSLLSAAQSGLAGPFGEFMDRQGISHMRIDSYEICEGGFSTLVRNENILCGTASCLSLYGVTIPSELNLKNAMYVALDGKLSGIFTVAYRPTKSVQSAMISMLRGRLKLFVSGRDFNISPLMVQQKLQIPVDDMEYLPFRQACTAADNTAEKVPHVAAVSVHSTPGTMAETVIGARRLRIIAGINTVISVATAFLGMLIMLLFARIGAGGSVSPSSLCEYMLAMEIITILISYIA